MRIDGYEVNNGHVIAVFITDKKRDIKQHKYEPARPHGEWIRQKTKYGYAHTCECSLCERVIYAPTTDDLSDFPYCHCGADMRGGRVDENSD